MKSTIPEIDFFVLELRFQDDLSLLLIFPKGSLFIFVYMTTSVGRRFENPKIANN
jgi:hypothetical protein